MEWAVLPQWLYRRPCMFMWSVLNAGCLTASLLRAVPQTRQKGPEDLRHSYMRFTSISAGHVCFSWAAPFFPHNSEKLWPIKAPQYPVFISLCGFWDVILLSTRKNAFSPPQKTAIFIKKRKKESKGDPQSWPPVIAVVSLNLTLNKDFFPI